MRYTYKNKDYRVCLNEFAEGVYGVNECQEQMLALVKKCKQKNTWIKDPKVKNEYDKALEEAKDNFDWSKKYY